MDIGWIQTLVGILVGAVTLLTAMVSVFGSSARSIRNGLKTDGELIDFLDGDARDQLRADLQRRTYALLAAIRYPGLTLYEVLEGLLLAAIFALLLLLPRDIATYSREELLSGDGAMLAFAVLNMMVIAFLVFARLSRSWCGRARMRLAYVRTHLGDDDATRLHALLKFPAWAGCIILTATLSWAVLTQLSAASKIAGWGLGVVVLGAVITVAIGLAVVMGVSIKNSFDPDSAGTTDATEPSHPQPEAAVEQPSSSNSRVEGQEDHERMPSIPVVGSALDEDPRNAEDNVART
ncbi:MULTISPECIES: hypothetical protein [unclassified Pseudoclavibacter]|uniref:hypothetical protein n=1 Tax=unclassified Pseudoclavibacter TaxID=2615177 RepID=UPI001BA81CCD|nr:hypothetical protein [Pseudoclavibacter sp. Marseille-Q4354]MBS3177244.1 hypothetical protein [Pseudoclavibacter sp. Marseille-Q4354]